MPSKARTALDANLKDIDKLLELHEDKSGKKPGRRFGLEVLNKSAIVLICAYWEAYCEDLAAEALEHLVSHAKTASNLPVELRKNILKRLKAENNELTIWKIADDGWKQAATDCFADLKIERDRKLNTPKTAQIDSLFESAIGLTKVSSGWRWAKRLTVQGARDKLDSYVTLRGSIAHRGNAANAVTKANVTDFLDFIRKLAARTGGTVNTFVKAEVGTALWTSAKKS